MGEMKPERVEVGSRWKLGNNPREYVVADVLDDCPDHRRCKHVHFEGGRGWDTVAQLLSDPYCTYLGGPSQREEGRAMEALGEIWPCPACECKRWGPAEELSPCMSHSCQCVPRRPQGTGEGPVATGKGDAQPVSGSVGSTSSNSPGMDRRQAGTTVVPVEIVGLPREGLTAFQVIQAKTRDREAAKAETAKVLAGFIDDYDLLPDAGTSYRAPSGGGR